LEQRIIDLYDDYTHAPRPRRVFLDQLAKLGGGTTAALALLRLLEGTGAQAAIVPENDARLDISYVTYPGAAGAMRAYLCRARGSDRLPAVVVIHENRGLNRHIEDVARRLALEGFLALAPDALSPAGGTPQDEDEARTMIRALDGPTTLQNYLAALSFLKGHALANGKAGCVGFCWGGAMSNELAVNSRELDAAAVYYGRSPKPSDVPKITAPLLLHYAALDKRINAGVPEYETALKKHAKRYTLYIYEGANHAFNNDTRPARYNKAAADLAWQRTVSFLKKHLDG
jgi:carboxymethylenebutenolidase